MEKHIEVPLSAKCGQQSQLTVLCMTNTNGTMIDMCRKFHATNLACLKGCYEQLCQVLRTGQAVLIEIRLLSKPRRISFAVLRSNVSVLW